ncbi:MAG TPA: GAF domain-containing protein [bacterium]|nr:GAF domain-containing protein [bacterium]
MHRASVRLVLVVVLSVLLTSGFSFYTALMDRRAALSQISSETLRLVRSAELFQDDVVEQTRDTLFALGSTPPIRDGDWKACAAYLRSELRARAPYTNLGVANRAGDVVCSALPVSRAVNVADRVYFQRAVASRSFSIGEYQVGRVTGIPAVNFAAPVFDSAGGVKYVVFAALDLSWYTDLAAKLQLPPGATLDVFDAHGVLLVGYPDLQRRPGQKISYSDAIDSVLRRGSATTERVGWDGVRRMYGITRLSTAPAYANSYVSIGIPVAPMRANVRHAFWRSLRGVGLVTLAAVLLALAGAVLYIQRPLDSLRKAAKRLAAGDLSARAGSVSLGGELRPVIATFDDMASTLERRTTALHDAEAQYRALVEQSLVGVAVVASGAFVYVNDALANIVGYAPEEMLGRPDLPIVHPDDGALVAGNIRRLREGDDAAHYTFRALRKDGSVVEVEVYSRKIEYHGRHAVMNTVVDISDRIRFESALRASEQSYRNLVDRVPVGLFRSDGDGHFLQLNAAGLEIIGCPDFTTASRLNITDLYVDQEDRQRFWSNIQEDGTVAAVEFRLRRLDGRIIWIRDRARVVRDDHGRLRYFEGFLEDITAQKRAVEEQERRRAERDGFHDFSVRLRAAKTSHDMHPIIVEQAMKLLGADHVTLNLLAPGRRQFMHAHSAGAPYDTNLTPVFDVEGSCSGEVIASGTSRVTDDLMTDRLGSGVNPADFTAFGPRVIVPVRTDAEAIGTLVAVRLREPAGNAFTPSDVRLLEGIAEIGGIAIRRAELAESLAQRVATLTALYGSAQRLAGTLDHDQLAGEIVGTCTESFGLRMASLGYLEDDGDAVMAAHHPRNADGVCIVDGRRIDFRQADSATCGRLREAASPIVLQNLAGGADHPAWETGALAGGMHSAAFLPLISRSKPFGFLAIFSDQTGWFTAERLEFLTAYAHQAAAALQNARLFDAAERRMRELEALNDIDRAVRGSLDLRVILHVLLDKATQHLNADAVDVLLLDPDAQMLTCAASRGFRSGAVRHVRLRLGEGYPGQVALTGRPISVEYLNGSAETHLGKHVQAEGFVSYHAMPLVAKGVVKGVLSVLHRSALRPTSEWRAFFEALAGQAATAIDNVTLFDDLRKANSSLRMSYDQTIEGWSRALDLRDRETEGHSQRVTHLTLGLARAMGVSEGDLVHVRRGALLHDIGKMGVPDAILLKSGPLTDREREIMRRHPAYARDLLSAIGYLHPALDIPYSHHEKWDGTGYPQGLSGYQIPLAARVFAVADVWDALRSDRPYRRAWGVERARAYIREQAGRHFDPQVVVRFMEVVDQGGITGAEGRSSTEPPVDETGQEVAG